MKIKEKLKRIFCRITKKSIERKELWMLRYLYMDKLNNNVDELKNEVATNIKHISFLQNRIKILEAKVEVINQVI